MRDAEDSVSESEFGAQEQLPRSKHRGMPRGGRPRAAAMTSTIAFNHDVEQSPSKTAAAHNSYFSNAGSGDFSAKPGHHMQARDVVDLWTSAAGGVDSRQEAARKIQLAALPRLIANRTTLNRAGLLARLELEVRLQRGLRLLLLCVALFCVVIYLNVLSSQSSVQLGLLNTFATLFRLDDSIADITTANDLLEYLRMVMTQSRELLPLSSHYFVEQEGEIKVFQGLQSFEVPSFVELPSLKPRVDSEAFSILAWVQLEPGSIGANILRKPLGKAPNEKHLSCWGWFVGVESNDSFAFGAHDFAGSVHAEAANEETVVSDTASAADGKLHNVGLVVTQTNISFWKDAELQSVRSIDRPVTDCSGRGLQIGDADVPLLGEVTFFPRALDMNSMREILYAGYTLQAIAAGKVPTVVDERASERASERVRERESERESQRERERVRERESEKTERQRHRETERERNLLGK